PSRHNAANQSGAVVAELNRRGIQPVMRNFTIKDHRVAVGPGPGSATAAEVVAGFGTETCCAAVRRDHQECASAIAAWPAALRRPAPAVPDPDFPARFDSRSVRRPAAVGSAAGPADSVHLVPAGPAADRPAAVPDSAGRLAVVAVAAAPVVAWRAALQRVPCC